MSTWRAILWRAERDLATTLAIGIVTAFVLGVALAGAASPDSQLGLLLRGARTLAAVAGCAMLLALTAGSVLGAAAAWAGGRFEGASIRVFEVLGTFPGIAMVAVVRALDRGDSLWSLILALALVRVADVARTVRVEVLRLRACEFVQAAVAMGGSPTHVLVRHLGPHLVGVLGRSALFGAALLVLLETAMSFVGFGVPQGAASWGAAIAEAISSGHPDQAFGPAAALLALLWALVRIADAVGRKLRSGGPLISPLRMVARGNR